MKKEILEKFSKEVLIRFLMTDCWSPRFDDAYCEGQLLFYQWDMEEEAIARAREKIMAENGKLRTHAELLARIKKDERLTKRWDANQKVYEKSMKVRGFE
jgi:hypothetical protein